MTSYSSNHNKNTKNISIIYVSGKFSPQVQIPPRQETSCSLSSILLQAYREQQTPLHISFIKHPNLRQHFVYSAVCLQNKWNKTSVLNCIWFASKERSPSLVNHMMWSRQLSRHTLTFFLHVAASSGSGTADLEKLCAILEAVPALKYICLDVANGYSEYFVEFVKTVRGKFPKHTIMVRAIVHPLGWLGLMGKCCEIVS